MSKQELGWQSLPGTQQLCHRPITTPGRWACPRPLLTDTRGQSAGSPVAPPPGQWRGGRAPGRCRLSPRPTSPSHSWAQAHFSIFKMHLTIKYASQRRRPLALNLCGFQKRKKKNKGKPGGGRGGAGGGGQRCPKGSNLTLGQNSQWPWSRGGRGGSHSHHVHTHPLRLIPAPCPQPSTLVFSPSLSLPPRTHPDTLRSLLVPLKQPSLLTACTLHSQPPTPTPPG